MMRDERDIEPAPGREVRSEMIAGTVIPKPD